MGSHFSSFFFLKRRVLQPTTMANSIVLNSALNGCYTADDILFYCNTISTYVCCFDYHYQSHGAVICNALLSWLSIVELEICGKLQKASDGSLCSYEIVIQFCLLVVIGLLWRIFVVHVVGAALFAR